MPHRDMSTNGLSAREQAALQALVDKRGVLRATGHGIAARTMGMAIWLVWQVFRRFEDQAFSNTQPLDTQPLNDQTPKT
jgi:hypothetical protein